MDKMKWAVPVLAGLIFASCQGGHTHSKELSQLDSLQTVIGNYELSIDSLNNRDIDKLSAHVDSQFESVLVVFQDSADRDFWLGYGAYFGSINKSLKRYSSSHRELREDLEYSAHQMATLANSIKDEKLADEEIEKYFQTEVSAFQNLKLRYFKSVGGVKEALVHWDSLGVTYDSIANYHRNLP